ncbi:MAG: hypothetical protein EOM02_11945 [Synergistales bacterium]|nr:hypothetical protein [Synergistales bacterium]
MHIDGSKMANFTCYKWSSVTYTRNNVLIPDVDSVEVSELGSGLNDAASRIQSKDWSKAVEGLRDNDIVEMVASSVVEIGSTMERMKAVSKLAEESYLSKEDRLTLQAEMTSLQTELFKQTHRMGLKRAGFSKKRVDEYLSEIDRFEASSLVFIERERARLANESEVGPFTANDDGSLSLQIVGFSPGLSGDVTVEDTDYDLKVTGDEEDLSAIYEMCDMHLSFEDFLEESKLSVMTVDSAAWASDSLDKMMDGFLKEVESMTSFYDHLKERQAEAPTEVIIPAQENGKGVDYEAPEYWLFQSDVRIKRPKNPSEEVFKVADAFFKDVIFQKLGFADFIPKINVKVGGPKSIALI